MNIHQAVEFVEESEKFKDFKKENAEAYLAHGFCTFEREQSPWQVGYYSPSTQKITSFTAGEEVIKHDEDEAFRKEGHVPPLALEKVTLGLEEALAKAEEVRKEGHSAEDVTKHIIIVQTIEGRPVWNITLVTHAFTLLNVRTDASTGERVSFTADSVLNLGTRT